MSNIIMSMAILLPLFTFSCSSNEKKNDTIEEFAIASPIQKDTIFSKEYVAEIQAIKNVEIRSRVNGFIDKIHVDEGQFVKEGQLLFSISAQAYSEDLQRAKAQLKSAQAELKSFLVELRSVKELYDKRIISKTEVELAEAKLDAAQAKCQEIQSDVSIAQMNISFTKIKAPFSGYINRIPYKLGSLVEEGSMLTTISDNQDIYAYFRVAELEYLSFMKTKALSNKKDLHLILADNSLHSELGVIETVEGEVDRTTGNIAFRAKFANPNGLLKHGATGKIRLDFNLKKAVLIPMSATFEVQENYYVYVVDGSNTVHLRRIFPKVSMNDTYVLSKGISSNEHFLTEGIQLVKEGQKIKVKQSFN